MNVVRNTTTARCPACWGDAIVYVEPDIPEHCQACGGHGVCNPVPARGQQAVPWEWTP